MADDSTQLPVGDGAAEQVISLPMHPYLDEIDQKIIVNVLRDAANPDRLRCICNENARVEMRNSVESPLLLRVRKS